MGKTYQVFNSSVIHELLDSEVIIADLDSGAYYSLRGSAAPVWQLLAGGQSLDGVCAEAAKRYPAAPPDLRAKVERFAQSLCELKLLRDDAAAPRGPLRPAEASWPSSWAAPEFEKYDEMKDLLMLDPIHEVDEQGWPHQPAP
jgi:hypothetical protein